MKIRRYVAKDMRLALKQVREQQGPDAVILSTRNVDDGVEVVAAIDYDEENAAAESTAFSSNEFGNQYVNNGYSNGSYPGDDGFDNDAGSSDYDFAGVLGSSGANAHANNNAAMNGELNALRRMLETQLAALAWNDLTRRAPVHTEVLKELTTIGITPSLAAELVSQLPARCELAEAQRLSLALLSHRIHVQSERWLDNGAVVAMVGPTGVGKTSVIAKFAARWALRYGARELALISTDNSRIGAQDQMQIVGRLLGVPTYAVEDINELPLLLADLTHRKMVLIDTAGFSQRDPRLAVELNALRSASDRLETALVLSASSQAGALEETIRSFAPANPTSVVLTKLDEAASLGGALAAVIGAQLPISYVSDGQRLAEDLHPARAHQLVVRAVQLSRTAGATADEDLLSRRFGGIAHALA